MEKIKLHTFYFGKIDPKNDWEDSEPEGWEPGWYYRVVIKEDVGEIHIEDTCGRFFPLQWQSLLLLQKTLNNVGAELIRSILGDTTDPNNV
jgi:hypothetical protein